MTSSTRVNPDDIGAIFIFMPLSPILGPYSRPPMKRKKVGRVSEA